MGRQEIESLLLEKSISPHHVGRYINFIFACMEKNCTLPKSTYTERHHILPKANTLFPEYKNLKKNLWNKARLTPEQHFVAHHILWKACGKFMAYAFTRMWNVNPCQSGKRIIRRGRISQKRRDLMTCPHCGKECNPTNAARWHFDKCKVFTGKEKHDVKQNIQVGQCPHCGLAGKMQGLLATHFDQCRVVIGNRQKNTPKATCPHCGFYGQKGGAMNAFHFDNCPSFTGKKRTPHRGYDRTIGTCPHCDFVGSEHGLQSRHYDLCPSLKPKLPKIQCSNCMKEGNDNNYFKHQHFDNCKRAQRGSMVSSG